MKKKDKTDSFCVVPWVHTYISPLSKRKLCCFSREENSFAKQYSDFDFESRGLDKMEYSPQVLADYWNDEFIRGIRLKMLSGEVPKECLNCHSKEFNLKSYKDIFTVERFPDFLEEAKKHTDLNGFTTLVPRSFDYRFSNECNFSCRMCGDELSSRWERETIDRGTWDPKSEPWMIPEVRAKIKDFQGHVVEAEFLKAIKNGEVEDIYWVGGEPLLWDIHWESMQYLVDSNKAKDITVRYNTNLSLIKKKETRLFEDLLVHFKDVKFLASVDATGEIGEYIRTGLSWKSWLANVIEAKKFEKENKHFSVLVDMTLTLPGLFDLKNVINMSNKMDLMLTPKLIYSFDPSLVLSPFALPRPLLDEILNEIIKYNMTHLSKFNSALLKLLLSMKKMPTFEEKYPDTWKEGFKIGRQKQLDTEDYRKDKFRMKDILKNNSSALEWWEQNLPE